MPNGNMSEWPECELRFVENELAKEYASISTTLIRMVMDFTKAVVSPQEGRVKLLAEARKNLSR